MSGWAVITVRGKSAHEYDLTRRDWEGDRSYARDDIVATFDEDSRVRAWDVYADCVYGLLNCPRYDFGFSEELFEDYSDLIDDAVVLGWNDTTDTGCARYYPRPDLGQWTHQYEEDINGEKGERACAVMYAQHGIYAQNPFHNHVGKFGEKRLENGNVIDSVLDQ